MNRELELELGKLTEVVLGANLSVGGEVGLSLEPLCEGREVEVGRALLERVNVASVGTAYELDEQRISIRHINIERIR
ncbi:hypothetical protein [Comamonas sp.]|uniref:hypothetical protein n=1 Tax=Comamonas sp. TaxID=34028 RepID=UPI00289CB448|nr:hypothetical protein [Comamonas sp.]